MSNERALGRLGELIVAKLLDGTLSSDEYDQHKDVILKDGTCVEVKTQVRWVKYNSFCVSKTKTNNNLKKCLNVDRLIFVEPGLNDIIRIFECKDRSYKVMNHFGNISYMFNIDKMDLIYEIKNKQVCDKMIKLTTTDKTWIL